MTRAGALVVTPSVIAPISFSVSTRGAKAASVTAWRAQCGVVSAGCRITWASITWSGSSTGRVGLMTAVQPSGSPSSRKNTGSRSGKGLCTWRREITGEQGLPDTEVNSWMFSCVKLLSGLKSFGTVRVRRRTQVLVLTCGVQSAMIRKSSLASFTVPCRIGTVRTSSWRQLPPVPQGSRISSSTSKLVASAARRLRMRPISLFSTPMRGFSASSSTARGSGEKPPPRSGASTQMSMVCHRSSWSVT